MYLCWQSSERSAAKSTFIGGACLGVNGRDVGKVMGGFADAEEMTRFLSRRYPVPIVDRREYEVAEDARGLPFAVCERHAGVARWRCAHAGRTPATSRAHSDARGDC